MSFMENIEETLGNVSVTENGALGYKSTGKALLDINFAASSLRTKNDEELYDLFIPVFEEDIHLAIKWLFFLRDVRGGMGERSTFRRILSSGIFPNKLRKQLIYATIDGEPLIPYFGRWDDLISLYHVNKISTTEVIQNQLKKDIANMREGKSVSLLAKWMPSINTHSRKTVELAKEFAFRLCDSQKTYRKILSSLRKYIDVTERKMSSNNWGEIEYERVSSKANLIYANAFIKHDEERRNAYLNDVKAGKVKINSGTLYPHEIYNKVLMDKDDENYISLWNSLIDKYRGISKKILIVADGSGSMECEHISSRCTALDVSNSLAIFFAELLEGDFHNKYITFGSNPKLIDLNKFDSFLEKCLEADRNCDCTNTDLERTFELILDTAINKKLKQEDLPEVLLIISDMEFDEANHGNSPFLFNNLKARFIEAGYKIPRLVFWNVCSRTNTIPLTENELGVALVSGFSPNNLDMIISGELDPYKCLVDKLNTPRYNQIIDAIN